MSRYSTLELERHVRDSVKSLFAQDQRDMSNVLLSIVHKLAEERISNGMARGQYKQSVQVDLSKDKNIKLDDGSRWALRLEKGGPRIDMREYMLKGRTYRNVPMDRSVASAKQYASTAAVEPWTAGSIKSFLDHKILTMATVRGPDGTARLQATNAGSRMPAGSVMKIKPEHVADPFARMVKLSQTYAKTTQTTGLRVWRRISEEGRGVTWMQPEQKALNILGDSVRSSAWQQAVSASTSTLVAALAQALSEALHGQP